MKRSIIVLLGAALATLLAAPASAQQAVCGDRNEIISRLENGYEEANTGLGLSANGGVVELYTSKKGTWTLMLTQPNGVSCLIAAGDNWEHVEGQETASRPVY